MNNKIIISMTWFLFGAILIQRLSVAVGNVLFGVATALFLFILYKKKEHVILGTEFKSYYFMFGIFLLTMFPSVLFNGNIALDAKFFTERWIYRVMPFFMLTFFVKDTSMVRKMLYCWAAGLCLDSMVAVAQVFAGTATRGWGFGGNPLTLPGILCMLFPLVLIIVLDSRFSNKLRNGCKISSVFCFPGIIAGLSRSAWIDMAILLPFIALPYLLKSRKKMLYACLTVFFVIGIFAINPVISSRLKSVTDFTTNKSNIHRVLVWESAGRIINDNMLIGIGPSQFRSVYQKYRNPLEEEDLVHTHNSLLQVFVDNGLLGFMGCIAFFCFIFYHNIKSWLGTKNPYALMIVGTTSGLLLNGMTDNNFDNSAIIKTFWFLLGCLLLLKQEWNYNNQKIKSSK